MKETVLAKERIGRVQRLESDARSCHFVGKVDAGLDIRLSARNDATFTCMLGA